MKRLLFAVLILPLFGLAQNITNTLGTGGKFEVETSAGTPIEVLTVTDGSQVIVSDIDNPTAQTDVLLDLNSINKTLQLPKIDPSVWITNTHGAGRLFWNTGGSGNLEVFIGTGATDFTAILDSRSKIGNLFDTKGNGTNSYYIGTGAGGAALTSNVNNTALGAGALSILTSGTSTEAEENVAIGTNSGQYVTTGKGNTAIGAESGVPTGSGALNYTTAIGYDARPDADNQIRLGTTNEHVVMPGNVNIGDVLNLTPKGTDPTVGAVGDIYYSSFFSTIMICITAGDSSPTPPVWKRVNLMP